MERNVQTSKRPNVQRGQLDEQRSLRSDADRSGRHTPCLETNRRLPRSHFDVSTFRRFDVSTRRGLTLIETALATIIVGVGVLAIVIAQQAFHNQNSWSNRAATATRLGNEIREMTFNLPRHDPVTGTAYWGPEPNELSPADFDDLDDFDGQVFSADDGTGPLNAARQVIPNMSGWAQIVQVDMVDPFDINHVFAVPETPEEYPEHYLMRVQVIVTYQQGASEPEEVTRVSWIAPN